MTYKFDIGVYIVPKHVYEQHDWFEFTNYDQGQRAGARNHRSVGSCANLHAVEDS